MRNYIHSTIFTRILWYIKFLIVKVTLLFGSASRWDLRSGVALCLDSDRLIWSNNTKKSYQIVHQNCSFKLISYKTHDTFPKDIQPEYSQQNRSTDASEVECLDELFLAASFPRELALVEYWIAKSLTESGSKALNYRTIIRNGGIPDFTELLHRQAITSNIIISQRYIPI